MTHPWRNPETRAMALPESTEKDIAGGWALPPEIAEDIKQRMREQRSTMAQVRASIAAFRKRWGV